MALAVTLRASGEADLGTGSHAVSEALAPIVFAADSLVLVLLAAINGDGAPATPYLTCSAAGLTFGAVADGYDGADFQAVARALTADHSAGGSTTITVSSDGENTLGIFFAVYEVTGYDGVGPIGATAGNTDGTTDGSRTLTLDSAPAATSTVIAGITADTNSGTNQVTTGTGWTQDAMVDSSGSNFGFLHAQRRSGSTSTGVVWDDVRPDGSAQVFSTGAVAVEVVEGAAAAETVTLAGTLPALTGSATVEVSADAQLAGTLPALTADFSVAAEVDMQLSGTLPTLTGSFNIAAPGTVTLAGTLPALEGSFTIAGGDLVNLDFVALAPVFAHGPATTPEFRDRVATTPEFTARTALAPAFGHGDPGAPTT